MATLYRDNPSLDLTVVTTVNGNKEYRVNCKKILDKYYVMNEDCFFVANKWYRKDSGLILFDSEKQEWVLKSTKGLIEGIIKFEDGKPVFGYFTPNKYNNCRYKDYTVLSPEVLIYGGKVEDVSTGIWEDIGRKDVQTPKNVVDHTGKGYSIEDNATEFKNKIDSYAEYNTPMGKNVRQYGAMLGDTTFGIEVECAKGFLPEHLQNRLGVVICRDGSLKDENGMNGPEFVTVPYFGAKGLQSQSNLSKELNKRTTIDLNCSYHIHFGNIDTSRIALVSLYKLTSKIQNEIFTMFPYYKAQPAGIKSKNYNKKLPVLDIGLMPKCGSNDDYRNYINEAYTKIFSWLSEGYIPDMRINRKNKKHPATDKWNRHERYYWVNFMNTIFSDRNTVEFRLHGPTTNAQKMTNWLFICNAILKYSNLNYHKILSSDCDISLKEVLSYYEEYGTNGKFLSEYLSAYVDERKAEFLKDYIKGDKVSKWDIEQDKDYVFSYKNVKHLF